MSKNIEICIYHFLHTPNMELPQVVPTPRGKATSQVKGQGYQAELLLFY